MAGTRRSGGSNVALTTRKRRSGGAWINITTAKRRVSGAWVDLFPEHSVSCSAIFDSSEPNGAAGTKFSTATVTGGIGPFTYAWSWQSGGAGMSLSNTTSATVSVNSTGTNQVRSGTLLCQVTDTGNGSLVKSGTADVSITHGIPP